MYIDGATLPSLVDLNKFKETFSEYVKEIADRALLFPKICSMRLYTAHYAWRDDIRRVGDREENLTQGLDHFKQCGHLTYWIRRTSPVIEYIDRATLFESADDLYEDENALRELLSNYGNEYFALDFGLMICRYYEEERLDKQKDKISLSISTDFLIDICHMLKFKNVSPHAIYLIYKSLF